MSTVTFYIIPENIYPLRERELIKQASLVRKHVLYISLFKRLAEIEESLDKEIHNVTIVARKSPSTYKQFVLLEEYCSLARLSEIIDHLLKKKSFDLVFFDSFCDLAILNEPPVCKKFLYYLKSHFALRGIDLVAVSKDNECSSRVMPLVREQVDAVLFEK